MLIKVVSLIFDPIYGGFNDEQLQHFLKDKQIIAVDNYLLTYHQTSYLTFVIKYLPLAQDIEAKKQIRMKDESWKETLDQNSVTTFNLLRAWRGERCKKDGVPSYIIFHNQQLALIAKNKPQSLSDLAKMEGIGKAKLDKYGAEILEITRNQSETVSDQNTKSSLQ